jgi:hypothetical protein
MLSDTHPDAQRAQIESLRGATGAQRLARTRSHTALIVGLSRQAIARANPQLDRHEVDMLWMESAYGKDLVERISRYLKERNCRASA